MRRVYPRDLRARPQPPPPRRPRPSTPPHIRAAAQRRAYATHERSGGGALSGQAELWASAWLRGVPRGGGAGGQGWGQACAPAPGMGTAWAGLKRAGPGCGKRAGASGSVCFRTGFPGAPVGKTGSPGFSSVSLLLFLPLFWLGAVQASCVIQFGFCETTEAHYTFFSLPPFSKSSFTPSPLPPPPFSFILGTKPRPQACGACALLLAPLAVFTFPLFRNQVCPEVSP